MGEQAAVCCSGTDTAFAVIAEMKAVAVGSLDLRSH